MTVTHKKCPNCKIVKPRHMFAASKAKSGLQVWCRECFRLYHEKRAEKRPKKNPTGWNLRKENRHDHLERGYYKRLGLESPTEQKRARERMKDSKI